MNTVRQTRDLFLTVRTGWDLIFALTPNPKTSYIILCQVKFLPE